MDDFKLKLYSYYLSIVSHVKILGLYINNNLTWRKYVQYICNGVSCLVGLLYRIKNYLNYESKVLFYSSYIISRIDYCLTIWGNAPKDAFEPLFRLQKELLVLFSMYQLKLHQFHVLIHYIGCQFTKELSIFNVCLCITL